MRIASGGVFAVEDDKRPLPRERSPVGTQFQP
jgi:hypothetical protein